MSKFTDTEIKTIKLKLNKKLNKVFVITLMNLPLVTLIVSIVPYIQNDSPRFDKIEYLYNVLNLSILFLVIMSISWVFNNYSAQKKLSQLQPFLRKKQVRAKVLEKKKMMFKSYQNILIVEGEFDQINITKAQSESFSVGEILLIDFEEQTKSIFQLKKI